MEMNHIRVKHKWGEPGNESRLPSLRIAAYQMEQLRDLQSLLIEHGHNVSMSVFIRAGLLSLISLIKKELERDPVDGLTVVVAMLERAAAKDAVTLH